MRKTVKLGAAAAMAAVLSTFISAGADAQQVRTFVSGAGTDSGICGVTTPCRHFTYALTQTGPGGEIVALDSAGYGAVTINQSVSISAPAGVEAAITAASGDGITIAAGASDVINLTGITLTGGGGANGITFTAGDKLNIKNCVVRGFSNNGINLTGDGRITVSDTIVSNNGNDGVFLAPTGPALTTAFFERVQAIGNGLEGFDVEGGSATGKVRVTATNSAATGNVDDGFFVSSPTGKAATMLAIVNSTSANNNFAGSAAGFKSVGPNAEMLLAGSTAAGNTTDFNASLGIIFSFGNNNFMDFVHLGSLTTVGEQ